MVSESPTISPEPASTALSQRFDMLRAQGRKALVCYVTAGHPSVDESVRLVQGLAEAGADVIELGIPFSDPMADGPVIQRSSQIAIDNGVDFTTSLDIVERSGIAIPIVLFSYLNPVLTAGDAAMARARALGVAGLLITDLPVGADPEREAWIARSGLDFVRLVAPTTPFERMQEIGAHGGGFVYLISRLGVTGERAELPQDLPDTVQRLRRAVSLPICIGFGISTPEQARAAADLADGVVVGSAIVRAAERSVDDAIALTASIRKALDA